MLKEVRRGKPVGAVANAMAILEFIRSAGPATASETAKRLGFNGSTTFNILNTLTEGDLLQFDRSSRRYALGFGLVRLAQQVLDPSNEAEWLRHRLASVADKFGVVVTAWRPANERLVLVLRADSSAPVRIHMTVGQRLPLFGGGMGRVAGAFMRIEPQRMKELFKSVRWHVPVNLRRFMQEVGEVRVSGWAKDQGEFIPGVTTISVPRLNTASELEMVYSAHGFSGQIDAATIPKIASELAACAASVRADLARTIEA